VKSNYFNMNISSVNQIRIGIGATFCCIGFANSAVVLTDVAPVVVSNNVSGTSFNLNPGGEATGDSTFDFQLQVLDFGPGAFLNVLNTAAGTQAPAPNNNEALMLGVGDSIGPSNFYSDPISGAFLASESSGTGSWLGGDTGYLGFEFQIAGATHYGFARVEWAPDDAGTTSIAIVDQVGYETVPGQIAVIPVPEPSTVLLSAVAGVVMLRRRRH